MLFRLSPVGSRSDPGFGSLEQLTRDAVARNWIEELVAEGQIPEAAIQALANLAREVGRPLRLLDTGVGQRLPITPSAERWLWQPVRRRASWLLQLPQRGRGWRLLKRALDIALSSLGLTCLSPVFIAIAVAVRLTSPGPVFYRWKVLGRNGRPVTGYKFRTMIPDAELKQTELDQLNEMNGPVFKIARDPRVTPFGRWLRKYSVDELPQLWSVLIGDLSLVGPRPSFPDEYASFELWQLRKLSVTPGITCLWQVSGRNAISDFGEWVRLDLHYIDHWSFWLDLKILGKTVLAVLRGTGY